MELKVELKGLKEISGVLDKKILSQFFVTLSGKQVRLMSI